MNVEIANLSDGRLPVRHAVDGRAFSPPVSWSGVPEGARSLALAMETVDHAGARRAVHWLAWNIDPASGGLAEGLMSQPEPDEPEGLLQGTADGGKTGYDGPVGTLGRPQRMRLRLLALDAPPDLAPAADANAFEKAVHGHVLEEAEARFEYVRPG